jgi:uncharacterized membrane protein
MKLDTATDTSADLDSAWSALVDVTTWPRWTPSIRSVRRLDDGPLRVGSRARIDQPSLPAVVWEVTELRDREAFSWSTRAPGLRSLGRHILSTNADGTTRITLELVQTGLFAGIFGALKGRRTREYLVLEAAGLKAASEAAAEQQ